MFMDIENHPKMIRTPILVVGSPQRSPTTYIIPALGWSALVDSTSNITQVVACGKFRLVDLLHSDDSAACHTITA